MVTRNTRVLTHINTCLCTRKIIWYTFFWLVPLPPVYWKFRQHPYLRTDGASLRHIRPESSILFDAVPPGEVGGYRANITVQNLIYRQQASTLVRVQHVIFVSTKNYQ